MIAFKDNYSNMHTFGTCFVSQRPHTHSWLVLLAVNIHQCQFDRSVVTNLLYGFGNIRKQLSKLQITISLVLNMCI